MKREKFIDELDEYVRQAQALNTHGDVAAVTELNEELNGLTGKLMQAKVK